MFGLGSSSSTNASSSSSSSESSQSAAPSRQQRQQCWDHRDAYFACLDRNGVIQPGDGELGDSEGKCKVERAKYEGSCGKSWIDYFNKRRILEIRQQKTVEAAARARGEQVSNKQ